MELHTWWYLLLPMGNFFPNLLSELALSKSCSVVLLIGIVPSGHDSPDKLHSWKLSLKLPIWLFPFGISGGSWEQKYAHKFSNYNVELYYLDSRIYFT